MAFTHDDLIRLSSCWRGKPEKLAERRKLWPDQLTWAWLLDPQRIAAFDRAEQVEIFSTAIGYAHAKRVRLWDRPGEIWRRVQDLAVVARSSCSAEELDAERLELGRRLAGELDAFDGGSLGK